MKALLLGALLGASACASSRPHPAQHGLALQYEQHFDSPQGLRDFVFSDESSWRWNESGTLDLVADSDYAPPQRSPRALALLVERTFGDFVLEVDLMQTGREYGHRDLCILFGFENPSRYYYVHLASVPDAVAHNVLLVEDAPRRALAPVPAAGVDWGEDEWHNVRLERLDGVVRVFFDRSTQPILEIADATIARGHVGLGSFDDVGRFDNLRIWSNDAGRSATAGF